MMEIVEGHFGLVEETPRRSHHDRPAIPAADAGHLRRRHPRVPRRHQALRAAARQCRRPRGPRRVSHRAGELAAGGVLRRRPRRHHHRGQRGLRRHHRLRARWAALRVAVPLAGRPGRRRASASPFCVEQGSLQSETPIRHRDGRITWAAVSINSVTADGDDRDAYVGTIRDVTAARASAARESAVVRLATAVGIATSVAEVLDILLEELRVGDRPAAGRRRHVDQGGRRPRGAGRGLAGADRLARPRPVPAATRSRRRGTGRRCRCRRSGRRVRRARRLGMMAVLSGAGRHRAVAGVRASRASSATTTGSWSRPSSVTSAWPSQHVRQFEIAREASLTLQRTMMPTTKPPVGFAVRYEPAVSPLEIGGDWYDVLASRRPPDRHHRRRLRGQRAGGRRGHGAAPQLGPGPADQRRRPRRGCSTNSTPRRPSSPVPTAPPSSSASSTPTPGEMTYSSAGHIPALLAVPGAPPETLTGATSVPLAVQKTGPRPRGVEVPLAEFHADALHRRPRRASRRPDRQRDSSVPARCSPRRSNRRRTSSPTPCCSGLAPTDGFDDDVAIVVYRQAAGAAADRRAGDTRSAERHQGADSPAGCGPPAFPTTSPATSCSS